jgi:hypothetical protein
MHASMHQPAHADIVTIAATASLYDWLTRRSRIRRPAPVPGHLRTDLGLPEHQRERDWSGWRPFG